MAATQFLEGPDGERIAWQRIEGVGPTVVFLGGFLSTMWGSKTTALADWARASGRDLIVFDYFGQGESSGDFTDGSITRWRQDALAILDRVVQGPVVLVGSSMGGWLACLVAAVRPDRVRGLVLIAPAADFTERLLRPEIPPEGRAALEVDGVWMRPSLYGDPYPITKALLEDGARWSILPGPVPVEVPVRILQGGEDPDVPWSHALELAQALKGCDVVFTLIRDGDHRLSRPQDLARLIAAVEEVG